MLLNNKTTLQFFNSKNANMFFTSGEHDLSNILYQKNVNFSILHLCSPEAWLDLGLSPPGYQKRNLGRQLGWLVLLTSPDYLSMWGVNRFSLKPPQLIQIDKDLADKYQTLQKPWYSSQSYGWGYPNSGGLIITAELSQEPMKGIPQNRWKCCQATVTNPCPWG